MIHYELKIDYREETNNNYGGEDDQIKKDSNDSGDETKVKPS